VRARANTQAGLTTLGNFTLWYAAYRIYASMQDEEMQQQEQTAAAEAEADDAGVQLDAEGNAMAADASAAQDVSDPLVMGFEDLGQAMATDNVRAARMRSAL
jgi:hypothetical protein